MYKTCIRCKVNKPTSDFWNNKNRPDGFYDYCKFCGRNYFNEYRKTTIGKISSLKAVKKYQKTDKGKIAINHFLNSKKHKIWLEKYKKSQSRKDIVKKYNNSEKGILTRKKINKAHGILSMAIKKNKVVKINICEKCGINNVKTEAHHPDYSKPLLVKWFCKNCHAKEHSLIRQKLKNKNPHS